MKKLFIALLAALLLAFAACAAPQQETAAPEPAQSESASAVSWDDLTFDRTLPLQYATQFSVSFAGEDYTRLTIGDDQTFLVVAGDAPVPDGVPADVTVLTRPLSHIYLVATAAMDYFRQLDAIDAIALSGQKEADWYIDEAKAAMQAGTMVYAGKYSAPDYETILAAGCDLAIENTMIYHTPEVVEQLEAVGVPVLVERSSYESDPLGRLEWLKLYAALSVILFLFLGCFCAIFLGRLGDFVDYYLYVDKKSGLPNRERCDAMVDRYSTVRLNGQFTVIHIQVDLSGMSRNDGDKALRALGDQLQYVFRTLGFVGCNGAGHFIVLLEDCSIDLARNCIDRLSNLLAKTELAVFGPCVFTGVSNSAKDDAYEIRALLRLAIRRCADAKARQEAENARKAAESSPLKSES